MFEAEKPQMKVIIYCFDSTVGPFRFMGDTFLTFTPIKEALLLGLVLLANQANQANLANHMVQHGIYISGT